MKYAKLAMAVAVTVVQGIVAATTDGGITNLEWLIVAMAFVNAVVVVIIPNLPIGSGIAAYAKTVTTAATAGLTLATTLILDGVLDSRDWWMIGVAALGAVGVWAVPNAPTPPAIAARRYVA